MKMKSPLFQSIIRPHITFSRLIRPGYASVLLLLFGLHAGLSSFDSPRDRSAGPFPTTPSRVSLTVGDWVLYSTVHNVDFYYQITGCSGDMVVLLKFNNRNADKVKVSWKEVFTTQFENDKEGLKGKKSLLLAKGETFEADCSNVTIKECVVHASQVAPTYKADIKKFTFKDITVISQ